MIFIYSVLLLSTNAVAAVLFNSKDDITITMNYETLYICGVSYPQNAMQGLINNLPKDFLSKIIIDVNPQ